MNKRIVIGIAAALFAVYALFLVSAYHYYDSYDYYSNTYSNRVVNIYQPTRSYGGFRERTTTVTNQRTVMQRDYMPYYSRNYGSYGSYGSQRYYDNGYGYSPSYSYYMYRRMAYAPDRYYYPPRDYMTMGYYGGGY